MENLGIRDLHFLASLTILFKDVVANGEYEWTPSTGMLPTNLFSNFEYL